MSRAMLKEEIRQFIYAISPEEMKTNRELNRKITRLGRVVEDNYPRKEFPKLDLPKLISLDLLLAKEVI